MTQNNPLIGRNQLWSEDALNWWQDESIWTPLEMGSSNWTTGSTHPGQAAWAFSPNGMIILKGVVTSGSDANVDPLVKLPSESLKTPVYGSYMAGFLNDAPGSPLRIYEVNNEMYVAGQTVNSGNTVRLDGYTYIPSKS